jgi:hypothetical protein
MIFEVERPGTQVTFKKAILGTVVVKEGGKAILKGANTLGSADVRSVMVETWVQGEDDTNSAASSGKGKTGSTANSSNGNSKGNNTIKSVSDKNLEAFHKALAATSILASKLKQIFRGFSWTENLWLEDNVVSREGLNPALIGDNNAFLREQIGYLWESGSGSRDVSSLSTNTLGGGGSSSIGHYKKPIFLNSENHHHHHGGGSSSAIGNSKSLLLPAVSPKTRGKKQQPFQWSKLFLDLG